MMAAVEDFVALVGHPGKRARRRVQQARAPAPLWWTILRQQPRLAVWLALNQHLPADLLAQLACHPVLPVRMAAASNPALDDPSLARLATDASELVRLRVVCRPGLPLAWLRSLSDDPCDWVAELANARLRLAATAGAGRRPRSPTIPRSGHGFH